MINRAVSGHQAEDGSSLCVWKRMWIDLRRIWNQHFYWLENNRRTFKTPSNMFTSGHPGHFTLGAASKVLQGVFTTPETSPQDLQQAPAAADVHPKETAHGRRARRNSLLSRRNMKARLTFARENWDKDQHFCNNVLWTEESKIELFGQNRGHVRRKVNTVFQEQKLVAAVKQEDRGLEMLCRSRTWPAPPVRGFRRTVWDHLQKTEQTGWKLRIGALIPSRCCGLAGRLSNISQPHEPRVEGGSKRQAPAPSRAEGKVLSAKLWRLRTDLFYFLPWASHPCVPSQPIVPDEPSSLLTLKHLAGP